MRRAIVLAALLAAAPAGAALYWLPPVANSAALPASGNVLGDTRVTLDDLARWTWDGDSWELPPAGAGVTSVALAAPSLFSVSGSPVTTTGTLTLALATQTANTVFAGPATGSAAAPTFRALVAADVPSPLTSSTSGNAATASALAANGANCSAGSYPLGVDASGAVEDCTAAGGGVSDPLTIGTVITTTGLEPRGQASGGQAAMQVQIGPGTMANGNSATYGSTAVGAGALAGGASLHGDTAVGSGATVNTGSQGTCIGLLCSAGYQGFSGGVLAQTVSGVAVGSSANGSGSLTVVIGPEGPTASGSHAIRVGRAGGASYKACISFGLFADCTAERQLVIGGESGGGWSTTSAYIGGGVTEADPDGLLLTTSGGSGSDISGGTVTIAGGKGTGNAAGGAVVFSTSDAGASGLTLQTLSEKARISPDGGFVLSPRATTPACTEGASYYDSSDHDFCDCVGASPAWRSRGGAGACTT